MGHTSFMSDKQPPRSEFFPRASSVASSVVISIVHQVGVSRKHRKVVGLERQLSTCWRQFLEFLEMRILSKISKLTFSSTCVFYLKYIQMSFAS